MATPPIGTGTLSAIAPILYSLATRQQLFLPAAHFRGPNPASSSWPAPTIDFKQDHSPLSHH